MLSMSFTDAVLVIHGEHFAPGERVLVYIATSPSAGFEQFTLLGEATTDARGALTLTIEMLRRYLPNDNARMAHVIAQGSVTGFTASDEK